MRTKVIFSIALAATFMVPGVLERASAQNMPSQASLTEAQTIYNNLTGVTLPQTNSTIVSMAGLIDQGNLLGAAEQATTDGQDYFIDNEIFPFASVMSTRAEDRAVPLSDFSATWMGYARDNLNLQGIFENPVIYSFSGVTPAPAADNDTHYVNAQAQDQFQDGTANSLAKNLVSGQPTITVADADSAGVLSYARGYFWDFAVAGTNRKLFEESLREFECTPLAAVGNPNVPAARIRRDVDQTSAEFQTKCELCHAVQDANNAWNFFAFTNNDTGVSTTSGQIAYAGSPAQDADGNPLFGVAADGTVSGLNCGSSSSPSVAVKVTRNCQVNPAGYQNTDNTWVNQLGSGNPNASALGMNSAAGGTGLASYGQLIANSSGFPVCMATRAFSQICLRQDFNADEMAASAYTYLSANESTIQALATDFAQNGYSLRRLFENTAIQPQCMGTSSGADAGTSN